MMKNRQTQEESEDDVSMDMEAPADQGPLFWSMKLSPNEPQEIDQPAIEGYIVHITSACFGANVSKGSRTVVMVDPSAEDDSDDTSSPVCVLRQGQQENQSLDLLFNESASFSLKGQKPSAVYLTGYIQPPVDAGEPMGSMDPMYEDMDEEQIMSALKAQRAQAEALDADDDDEDEEVAEPPAKKQKTASGAVAKKAQTKGKAQDKKRKNAKGKAGKDDDAKDEPAAKAEEKKGTKQNKKKKDKKLQTMKGGIKYRDMKEGDGEVVSAGDKLRVFYVGQTDDKKVFDKCISGSGFEFAFGKGDVIKGWDLGLKGMRVGGKRKLVIPPKQAYGAAGSPPNVPGNATLTFTIELKGKN